MALERLPWQHCRSGAAGYQRALKGHYHEAFQTLMASPRSLQYRMDAAICLYLVALYADLLSVRDRSGVYFFTAYRELYGAVDQRAERYGPEWATFGEYREESAFFQAVTAVTPLHHQKLASRFYKQPYLLPGCLYEALARTPLKPPQKPQEWLGRMVAPLHAQLALGTMSAGRGGAVWAHVLALTAFMLLFLGVAAWAYRCDEGRTYG